MGAADEDEGGASGVRSRQVRVWLAIVFAFVGTSALVLVGVFFGVGPFSGMRSVFVYEDPVWGTCYNHILMDPCDGIPLSTLEEVTGLAFPNGTTVIDSSYSGLYWKDGDVTALIRIPQGESSPLSEADAGEVADISGAQNYATAVSQLQEHGVTDLIVFDSIGNKITIVPYSRAAGWAVAGTADDGTYIYISVSPIK